MVSRSIIKLIKEFPAIGWIKADNLTDETSIKEIISLQRENEELKWQLSEIVSKAPKGTEILAQGDDKFSLKIKLSAEDEKNSYDCNTSINVTWNDIFAFISPYLIDECRNNRLHLLLNEYAKSLKDAVSKQKAFRTLGNFDKFRIADETFNIIKVYCPPLSTQLFTDAKLCPFSGDAGIVS